MKIRYPIQNNSSDPEKVYDYYVKCAFDMNEFKRILRNNLNISRWQAIRDRLLQCKMIRFVSDKMKPINIAYQYINNLKCVYDPKTRYCYYTISDFTQCIYTQTRLNKVMRYIEFGFSNIPPMNWIRHSYIQFSEIISKE